jgi:hypothetical protein
VYLLVLNDLVSCFNVLLLVLNNFFLFTLCFSTQQAFNFIFLLCVQPVSAVSYSGQSDHLNSGRLGQGMASISEGRASVAHISPQ